MVKDAEGKQPYRFTMKDGSLFYFAGLWEVWRNLEGNDVRTVKLITTEPNAVTQPVHDRMPVILCIRASGPSVVGSRDFESPDQ